MTTTITTPDGHATTIELAGIHAVAYAATVYALLNSWGQPNAPAGWLVCLESTVAHVLGGK